jgi:hypothetical protein
VSNRGVVDVVVAVISVLLLRVLGDRRQRGVQPRLD